MPDDPPSNTPPLEGERTLSDEQMTFSSKEPTSPKQPSKKSALKVAKAKLKARRSTPAPPTKGNGRKRFVPSPLPVDKQLRKRIDFGEEEGSPIVSPKCKSSIFPAPLNHEKREAIRLEEMVQDGNEMDLEMASPLADQVVSLNILPFSGQDSGQYAGEESADPEVKSIQPSHDKLIVLGAAKVQGVLGEERVNLPEMGMGPKMLLECSLVPCQNGGS